MNPQINLLDSIGQSHTKVRANTWFTLLLFGLIVIGAATFIQSDWVHKKQQQLAVEQQDNADLLLTMANFEHEHPNQKIEREVQADIARLNAEIQTQKTTLALVAPDAGIQRKGFYHYLAALSAKSRKGLWLTNIELNPGAHKARLMGQTLDPSLVPIYLDSLSETAFSQLQFGRMDMQKISDNPTLYRFDLDSHNSQRALNGLRVSP